MVLAMLGGVAGLLLAAFLVRLIAAHGPSELPRIASIAIDARVLFFSLLTTTLTGLLFCAAPAFRFSRPELTTSLRSGKGSDRRHRLRDGLVIAEVALAVVLLIGAGLLTRSFVTLLRNDPGFQTENRLHVQAFLWDRNPPTAQRIARAHEIVDALSAVPGVQDVAMTTALPFHPHQIVSATRFAITGRPASASEQELRSHAIVVSADYFRVTGTKLTRGRPFDVTDRIDAPRVALVNAAFAQRFFPNEDPVGQRITVGVAERPVEREIVGIVANVRPTSLDADPRPELYLPFEQSGHGSLTFVIRTSVAAPPILPAVRRAFWAVDPGQSIYLDGTLDSLVAATLVSRRFNLILFGAFSIIALALAAIGIYGLVSFSTQQRTAEIGIRMALGARGHAIVTMIVREGLALAAPGLALGVLGALVLTRFMRHMLYGVVPTDPITFVQLSLLVLLIAALAAWVPARRAVARDPVRALRAD
jgi:putative ABC transport system permease protein